MDHSEKKTKKMIRVTQCDLPSAWFRAIASAINENLPVPLGPG